MTIIRSVLALAFIAGCATDELYDPTGTWAMTAHWGTGTCGVSAPAAQYVTVLESRGAFVATTGEANESTTGGIDRTADSATLTVSIVNSDVNSDGGSTRATIALTATANESSQITGSGSITMTGGASCRQSFTLTGGIQ